MRYRILAIICMMALPGCASVIDGTSQEITINTNPSDAECTLNRKGISIGMIDPTPGSVTIKKTRDDITVVCNKDGYQEATYFNRSGSEGATWGNIVAGGLIGWGIDAASGADNHYDSPVNITLVADQDDEDDDDDAPKKHHHKKHHKDDDDDGER